MGISFKYFQPIISIFFYFSKNFDKDLREFIEKRLKQRRIAKRYGIVTSVNEVQRHVLVKGFYDDIVAEFLKEKGF